VTAPTIVSHQVNPGSQGTPLGGGPSGQTYSFGWSHDSHYFAFEAYSLFPSSTIKVEDAYVVDTTAAPYTATLVSTNRTVLPTSSGHGWVQWLHWAPTTNVLLFSGDLEVVGAADVFWSSVSGAAVATPPVLCVANPNPAKGYSVSFFDSPPSGNTFSPDGSKVTLHFADQFFDPDVTFVAPVSPTGVGTAMNVVTRTGDSVQAIQWSPDSKTLLCAGNFGTGSPANTIAVCDVSGSTPGPLVPVTTQGLYDFGAFVFTPDGSHIVYRVGAPGVQVINERTLTAGPTIGTELQVSAGCPTPTAQSQGARLQVVSPDSSELAYVGDERLASNDDLTLNSIGGVSPGVATRINPTATATVTSGRKPGVYRDPAGITPGNIPINRNPTFSADSRLLFYKGDLVVAKRFQLYMFDVHNGVPITGVVDILPQISAGGSTNGVAWFSIVD
jgi:hypothetical protein